MGLEDDLKMSSFRSTAHQVLLNIMFTGTELEGRIRALLKPYELTEQQYNVLRILRGQKGKPATLGVVQERMLHRMSNATRIVENLRKKGLVDRCTNEANRREVSITITKKGEELVNELDPYMDEHVARMAGNLTEKEKKQLNHLLDKFRG